MNLPPITRLMNTLENGGSLTSKQIASRFGVRNPRDLVYRLREKGMKIVLRRSVDTKGRVKQKYSMV